MQWKCRITCREAKLQVKVTPILQRLQDGKVRRRQLRASQPSRRPSATLLSSPKQPHHTTNPDLQPAEPGQLGLRLHHVEHAVLRRRPHRPSSTTAPPRQASPQPDRSKLISSNPSIPAVYHS